MENSFVIKVWDLLRHPWRLDTVTFDQLMIEDISWLSPEGVSGTLVIQWVNDGSVKVLIKQAKARVSEICDLSGEEYDREVLVENFDGRFSTEADSTDEDRVYDELFPLDGSGETINIYDLLVQSIKLQEPVVHIKPGKEYLLDEYDENDFDDEADEDVATGNILFH